MGLYGILAVAAVIVGAVRGDVDIYRLEETTRPWKLLASPFLGIGVGLVLVFASRWAVHRFGWARRLHRAFRGILGTLHKRDILVLAVASAVGEELLFRGALLPWLGLWPSTLIFALLHIGPGSKFLPWAVQAFGVGLLFGWLFLVMGDLGAPIVAHFVVNFLNLNYIVRVELPREA